MTITIVGGGAAGMLAAITAAQNNKNCKIVLIDKNEKLGKKLFITGKGRCNVTNACDNETFLKNVTTNPKFLYPAINAFDSAKVENLFNLNGCPLKTERGSRVFPVSDKSSDIIKCLEKLLVKNGVQIVLNKKITAIQRQNDGKFIIKSDFDTTITDKVVLATGGNYYKATGSTGDGYCFAKALGHKLILPKPSLIGFATAQKTGLQGLTLKNINLKLLQNGKTIKEEFGELMFTHEGISGPTALTLSAYACKLPTDTLKLSVDLKPALSLQRLDERILRDFAEFKNKEFKNGLNLLLPKSLADYVVKRCGIEPEKEVNSVTKAERKSLCELLKALTFDVTGFDCPDTAIITSGGVDVKEINPSTMESKIVKNLYFCGELIDVDALTGGFNLQIAFSTGYLAGLNAAKE